MRRSIFVGMALLLLMVPVMLPGISLLRGPGNPLAMKKETVLSSVVVPQGRTQYLPLVNLSGAQETEEVSSENSESQEVEPDDDNEKCKVSGGFSENILQWCHLITVYGNRNDIDPDLIASVMLQESGGNHLAYSRSGAVGLLQVMPKDGLAAAFRCPNGPCFMNRPTIAELQDPEFNIKYGTGMLAGLNAKYGNWRDALRYYGPKDVGYYYADKVLGIYEAKRK
jgi:soluble lytic murein transglycosylase-like protein